MIRPFNLAETKIAERSLCRREVNRRIRVVVALFVVTLVVAAGSFACKLSIAAEATRLKSQLADVKQRCVEVKREMSDVKARSGQRQWQRELTKSSEKWLVVLEDVLRALPADAWLTRVENSTQNNSVTLEGGAASYESISTYVSSLRRTQGPGEVRLTSSRVTAACGRQCVQFALLVKLKVGAATQDQQAQPTGVPPAQGAE